MRGGKWIVRGIAGTLVLLYAAGGATAQKSSKPVATVNGEVITMTELEAILKKDGPMAVPLPEAQRKQQQQFALYALVDQALLRQFLKQNAVPIEAKEVNARMADLVAGLKQQGKSLEEFCRDMNQSPAQVQANLATTLQWMAYARQHISDQEAEKYYRENKDMFDKVFVHASEIMLRVSAQASEAEKAKAKAQLTELRGKILANQIDFARAAKQYSQGPTKDQGGDLDWFPRLKGILPQSVLQAAFSLQPGQICDVIESEYGVHLIKVLDRKPGEPSDFTKIKETVRQLCIEEMQQDILLQLHKTAKVQIDLP
jgi:parvulin-like peptidyl-prolyl isomerase